MRAAVFIGDETLSTRVANDISQYFYLRHPEYYAKIVNFETFSVFDSTPGSYCMDLYILALSNCDETDPGYHIAARLRDAGINCALAFIIPSETTAVLVTRAMLRPSYIFIREAATREINTFLDSFLSYASGLQFMEFTFQYKKWLVNIENIIYIQTCQTRSLLVCVNATLETTERLLDLERRLPAFFLRVDKSCLINTKRLTAADFTEHKALFAGADFVYMSRRGSKKLYNYLNNIQDSTNQDDDDEGEMA